MWKWILLTLVLIYVFRRYIAILIMLLVLKILGNKIQKIVKGAQENQPNNYSDNNNYTQGDFSFNIPNQNKNKKVNNSTDFVDFEEIK